MSKKPLLSLYLFLFLSIFLLGACTVADTAPPTLAPTALLAPTPTLRPTEPLVETQPMAETATAEAPTAQATIMAPASPETVDSGLLPAPLYFLQDGQIVRLETDGLTLTPITAEPQPVSDFDVSQATGRVAYVTGNDLVETDALGGDRRVKASGPLLPEDDMSAIITRAISDPHYSPDGSRIAFGLNGVNLIASGDTGEEYQVLQPSDPYPEPGDLPGDGPIRFFWPEAWSPGGNKLLLSFSYWPEAGGLAIKDLNSGELIEITNQDSINIGETAWSTNGNMVFIASNTLAYGAPGLARADAMTGSSVTLVRGLPEGEISSDNPAAVFRAPHQLVNGNVLVFAQYASLMEYLGDGSYQMVRISPDGSVVEPLHDTWLQPGDILWADDGSGAVIVDSSSDSTYPYTGPMRWLPAGEGSPLDLPATGSRPRWGGPATAGSSGPEENALDTLRTQFLQSLAVTGEASISQASVRQINTLQGPRWLVHTEGTRTYEEPFQPHELAIYDYEGGSWQEQARFRFNATYEEGGPSPGPDYLREGGVHQVFVTQDATWIVVEGGVGAHGGTFDLLRYQGQALTNTLSVTNSFPGVGWVEDVNGDGLQEAVLDVSDAYVFCYACGVRLVDYQLLRWNGSDWEQISLTSLPEQNEATQANNLAVNLAAAGLWKQAAEAIARAEQAAPDDETIAWNGALIRLIAEGRANAILAYPLLGHIFYGDYRTAVDMMRGYSTPQLFSASPPLVTGTMAEGNEQLLSDYIRTFATQALAAPALSNQEKAAAAYLRGWATYLVNPNDPNALLDVQQAVQFDREDPLFLDATHYLR